MTGNFQQFDRGLEDLRNDVAIANLTMRDVIKRYIAMMDALEAAFVLYYEGMTVEERTQMQAAFAKLMSTVAGTVE